MTPNKNLAIFMVPLAAVLVGTSLFPLLYVLAVSFLDTNFSSNSAFHFVGLLNYRALFRDSLFTAAFKNTLIFSLTATALEAMLGTVIAIGLYVLLSRAKTFLYAILVIPLAVTPVAVALMWKYILNSSYGVLNFLLGFVGIRPIDWLGSKSTALLSIVIVDVWEWTPFVALVVLAGLEIIPSPSLDMASVDGATWWQMITRIIFPQVRPFIQAAVLLRIVDVLKSFDNIYVLTEGGPGSSTETLSLYGYRQALSFFNIGYASAESLVLLVLIVILVSLASRSLGSTQRKVA